MKLIDWLAIRFEIFWRRKPRSIHPFSRPGVKFTTAQKAKIQDMLEAGKTVEAQRMILDHLKKELGD